jgi:SH3 domain protein
MSKRSRILSIVLVSLLGTTCAMAAESRYIRDILAVALRKAPAADAEMLKTVKSGETVEVLSDEGQFIKVRIASGEEGWVAKQSLTSDPPVSARLSRAEAELTRLSDALQQSESERTKLEASLTELRSVSGADPAATQKIIGEAKAETERAQRELVALREEHEKLKTDSANVVAITRERDLLTAQLAAAQAESRAQNGGVKWFLAGAAVLASGWFLGEIAAARRKRNRVYS